MKSILYTLILTLMTLTQTAFAEGNGGRSCDDAASISDSEFYVCAQYYDANSCFESVVLEYKPESKCSAWSSVCLDICSTTDYTSDSCTQACK